MSKRKQSTEPQEVAPYTGTNGVDGNTPDGATRAKLAPGTDPDATQAITHVDGPSNGSSNGNGAAPKRASRSKAKPKQGAEPGTTESVVIKPPADGTAKSNGSAKCDAKGTGEGTDPPQ